MKIFKRINWKDAEYGDNCYGYIEHALFFSCNSVEIKAGGKGIQKWILRMYLPGFKEAFVRDKREAKNLAEQVLKIFGTKFFRTPISFDSSSLSSKLKCCVCAEETDNNFTVLDTEVHCLNCAKDKA